VPLCCLSEYLALRTDDSSIELHTLSREDEYSWCLRPINIIPYQALTSFSKNMDPSFLARVIPGFGASGLFSLNHSQATCSPFPIDSSTSFMSNFCRVHHLHVPRIPTTRP